MSSSSKLRASKAAPVFNHRREERASFIAVARRPA
jgi:hypothetical protein